MFWGLLIALVLTVAAVMLAFSAKKKEKAGVLSWTVAIAGFVILWIFGSRLAGNIEGRIHAIQLRDGISADLSELAANNLSSDVASFIEGYGLNDAASEVVAGEAVHYYTVRMWIDLAIVIVVFVAVLLLFVAFMEGRGGRSVSRATERHGGSGRNPKYHSRRR